MAPSAVATPPVWNAFATADRDQAREFLEKAYGWRLLTIGRGAGGTRLVVTHVGCGVFEVTDVTMPAGMTFQVNGYEGVVIGTVVQGKLQASRGNLVHRYQAGDVFIANFPHDQHTVRAYGSRGRGVMLPPALLASVAGAAESGPSGLPRFTSLRPVSAAAAGLWQQTAGYAGNLLSKPGAASEPLVVGTAARLLAATAFAVFPHTAVTELTAADRHDAHPAAVHQAVSFIEANAGRDITLADVAAAAHVSTRAVQLAFRRHLNTTPMAYLRRVRLDQARRQLQAADPARQTVTAVAYRWGFSSASRFTAYYRDAYGVLPSQTLKA
jgi:AraC-like DNA-binding protein/quercetin dioxygenase-like cupin family protein